MSTCYLFHHLFDKNGIKFGRFLQQCCFYTGSIFNCQFPALAKKIYLVNCIGLRIHVSGCRIRVAGSGLPNEWIMG